MKVKGMKQAGFSLVELMVVVGIIGILAALAVPRLQTFSAKAKVSEGKAVVNNMSTLFQSYYSENSDYDNNPAADVSFAINAAQATYDVYGYNRPLAANAFYSNPGANIVGNTFTIFTNNRLALCNGVPANTIAATVLINQNGVMTYGGALAPAAGVVNNRSPVFTCL
jgi:prepilin-type N-terminal cleavage/methylation domain-containing protein